MEEKKNKSINISQVLAALAIGFVPMLVHMHVYDSHLGSFDWFPNEGATQVDFFLYYKMIAIIIIAVIMMIVLIVQYKKKKLMWSNAWYLLAGYAVMVLLSGLFSDYKLWAFGGSYEVFESVIVILCYVCIAFFCYQTVTDKGDLRNICIMASVFIFVITLIADLQYFGFDVFRTSLGKRIITNISAWNELDSLSFTFEEGNSYTTLYNTNYLGFFYGLLIPILLVVCIKAKEKGYKIYSFILLVMSVIALVGSNSKTGLIALFAALAIGLLLTCNSKKNLIRYLAMFGIAGALLVGMYANRLGGLNQLFDLIFKGVDYDLDYVVQNIQTNDEDVAIYLNNEKELHISYQLLEETQSLMIWCYDHDHHKIDFELAEDGISWQILDPDYAGCMITPAFIGDYKGILVRIDKLNLYFTNEIDGTYYYVNPFAKFTKVEPLERTQLFDPGIMSGRGYIWNRMIPALKKSIILGSGANTFIMEYPNDDYIAKIYLQSIGNYDVKAHNLYLQQFMENGLIALLLYLAFYAIYFVDSVKLFRKRELDSNESILAYGIFLGTLVYMIVSIANDSNVCTAPTFWGILGIGIGINQRIRSGQS